MAPLVAAPLPLPASRLPVLLPRLALAVLLALPLAACQREAEAPSAGQQVQGEAEEGARLYAQLRDLGRLEQAELAGRNVLEKYPDSAAAAEVRKTYDALRAEVETQRESRRLAELWVYHAMPEEAGTVRTATIHRSGDDTSTGVAEDAEGLRLVLRQHPEWGQAVYLLVSNGDFDCPVEGCSVQVAFDQAEASGWKASVSREGPLPALFIEDDEAFIQQLGEASWAEIQAPLAEATDRPLRFEVAGFDRAHWLGEAATPADSAPATQPAAADAPADDADAAATEGG